MPRRTLDRLLDASEASQAFTRIALIMPTLIATYIILVRFIAMSADIFGSCHGHYIRAPVDRFEHVWTNIDRRAVTQAAMATVRRNPVST